MTRLDGNLREQFELWKSINPDAQLLQFSIDALQPLDDLVPVQQFSTKLFRGCVCEMEAGQPERVFD
eukprot:827665-Pyramimonas_sp.AAC.1